MNNQTKIIVYSLLVSAVISSSFHPVEAQAQIPHNPSDGISIASSSMASEWCR